MTAHQRLANAHGISHDTQLVGGYFDKSGKMQWNSRSIQGYRYGEGLNGFYGAFGVQPIQSNPLVYYGNNAFLFSSPWSKF